MGFMYYSSSKTSKSRADEIAGNPRPNIFLIKYSGKSRVFTDTRNKSFSITTKKEDAPENAQKACSGDNVAEGIYKRKMIIRGMLL